MKILQKIKEKIPSQFLVVGLISLIISVTSSLATYYVVSKRVSKFAVIDLAYLHNEFIINLARYLSDNQISEDKVTEVVKSYTSNLEALLQDVKNSGNYVLLQKQTVVSEGLPDVTKDVEKVLFDSAMENVKKLATAQEKSPQQLVHNQMMEVR